LANCRELQINGRTPGGRAVHFRNFLAAHQRSVSAAQFDCKIKMAKIIGNQSNYRNFQGCSSFDAEPDLIEEYNEAAFSRRLAG